MVALGGALPGSVDIQCYFLNLLYSITINSRRRIPGVNNFVLRKMCTPVQNHCPSCCTNDGRVYSRPCPVLYQLRPGQQGSEDSARDLQKHSQLKDKWANLLRLFWFKASEHTPCEICQNYQVEEEQPLRIIPLF